MKETIKQNDNTKEQKPQPELNGLPEKGKQIQSGTTKNKQEESVEAPKNDSPILDCGWI